MPLENLTGTDKFITHLIRTNPDGTVDKVLQGDDHLRGIKNTLLNTFPNLNGAVTATPAQLNRTAAATSNATGNTLALRNASGQFNMGAPTAAAHVARKAETDLLYKGTYGTGRNLTITAGVPSGGANGDLWVVVE